MLHAGKSQEASGPGSQDSLLLRATVISKVCVFASFLNFGPLRMLRSQEMISKVQCFPLKKSRALSSAFPPSSSLGYREGSEPLWPSWSCKYNQIGAWVPDSWAERTFYLASHDFKNHRQAESMAQMVKTLALTLSLTAPPTQRSRRW